MSVKKDFTRNLLKDPQHMKKEEHDQSYCWLLSFNFYLFVTYDSDYLRNRYINNVS